MTIISTSRIGRKPVLVPKGVDIKIQGDQMTVKGPKGLLTVEIHPFVKLTLADGAIQITRDASKRNNITGKAIKTYDAIDGTTRANLHNVIHGVSEGYQKKLTLVGVGYRAQAKGKVVALSLGFSHPTNYDLPEGITVETPTQTEIIIKGASKELVGQVAAQIRAIRGPEPYKGKGVRYADEKVVIKETKKK